MSEEKLSRVTKYNTEVIKKVDTEKKVNNTDKEIDEEVDSSPSFISKLIIYMVIIILAIMAYASLISPYFIDVKEYKIENNDIPGSFNGLKIVQFSDIHYGNSINKKQLDKVVEKINKLKPDVIVFTGDLISKDIEVNETIKNDIIDSLSKLEATLYKLAIYGDEDGFVFEDIMNSTNFIVLNNSSKLLYYKGKEPIVFTGLPAKDSQAYSTLNSPVDNDDIISYYQIVLVHEPDTIDNFIAYTPNVILSGHTLGGLIKLPFLKPLFLPDTGNKYYEDFYQIEDTMVYISNGVGTSSLNARLNNHPSISLYRLYTEKKSI